MSNINFDPTTGHHSFQAPNGKFYSSVNKSYIQTTYARFYGANQSADVALGYAPDFEPTEQVVRTEEEIRNDITARMGVLQTMTYAAVTGNNRSMIVAGGAGLGKSTSVFNVLNSAAHKFQVIKGHITPKQMYEQFYKFRHQGNIIVFDDCDCVFDSEVALNMLKAATDSTAQRTLSWFTSKEAYDEEGNAIPDQFDFDAAVIFITNKNFIGEMEKGNKLAPHFDALISRSHYVSVGMFEMIERVVRVKMLIEAGHETKEVKEQMIAFVEDNQRKLIKVDLRVVNKMKDLINIDPTNWKTLAKNSLLR